MSALRAALRKAVAPQGPSRRSFATSSPGPKPAEGEAPPEKVGFFVATAGLVGASLGAVAVFVVGVAGVLGAAKAVGAILGALPRSACASRTQAHSFSPAQDTRWTTRERLRRRRSPQVESERQRAETAERPPALPPPLRPH